MLDYFNKNAVVEIPNAEYLICSCTSLGSLKSEFEPDYSHVVFAPDSLKSAFRTEFKPSTWSFHLTKRNPQELFYANNMAVFQQKIIAEKYGFIGIVPSLIKRVDVLNTITLEKTEGKSGEELKRVFLEETPNGKSTQRILDDFGLKAIRVEKVVLNNGEGTINFHIHVRPLPKEKIR